MMNDHALRVLEYDKVREIVARFALTGPGRQEVLTLLPVAGGGAAELPAETRELLDLLQAGEDPPLDGVREIGPAVDRLAAAGAMLRPAELLDIASTLGAGRKLKAFFGRCGRRGGGSGPSAPRLCGRAAAIVPLPELEEAVRKAIDESGEVRDSASPALRRVRMQIGRVRDEVLDRITRMLKAAEAQAVVQEQVITVRDDRYVIPLKPNFRQSLKGIVHGRSGSRATLFVEPLEVVEQNNRLAELRAEEREEVERVLRELTDRMAGRAAELAATLAACAAIDAVRARAAFGQACGGTVPTLLPERSIRLRQARHPLLVWKERSGARQVVPNDIDLSQKERVLIISGPNAGGKTVVLKTVGLLCLMAQAGIPVTAAEGSELPVLAEVYADIGDEQDLEQDLSTFSSHAGRIAEILRGAGHDALVLLDELGSGTDPAEGAALGSAVLRRLLGRGCITVVTTHHSGIKLFGSRTAGAANGAMEFDPATLKPTYRFVPGRPGRSYGLDMAGRLGVPPEVIEEARALLPADAAELDGLLERIEQDSLALRKEREQAEADRVAAAALRAGAEVAAREAAEAARTIAAKAKQDAREVLARLRQRLKELGRTEALGREELRTARQEVEGLAQRLEPAAEAPDEHPAADHAFRPGDRVRLPKLRKTGTVLFAQKGEIEVDTGPVRLRVAVRDAAPLDEPAAERSLRPGWSADLEEREGAADRLSLLGMRVDEALVETDRFLDRAGLQGLREVLIIHGLGTGALKAAVTGFLQGHRLVRAVRPAGQAEGGAGATVAELER